MEIPCYGSYLFFLSLYGDFCRRLDSSIELLKASLQRGQLHITRLHWLHEDMFIQEGHQNNPVMVANRATVMSEIKKVISCYMFSFIRSG